MVVKSLMPIVTVRNEVAKVMFLQACVCPQGEVCSGGCLLPGGLLLGVSVPGGVCSQGVSAPSGVGLLPGELVSQHALTQTPPGETAAAADGTHPTGMHSCFRIVPRY